MNRNVMQDKKRTKDQNEGGSVFFVVGTFHKGVKKAEKSKLRNGREGFLWKEKDKKDVSVWELKTSHLKTAKSLKTVKLQCWHAHLSNRGEKEVFEQEIRPKTAKKL